MRRRVAAVLAGALAAATIGTVEPARAEDASCATTTSVSVFATPVVFGGYDRVSGRVTAHCTGGTGTPPPVPPEGAGTVVVERSVDDGGSWHVVGGGQDSASASWRGDGIIRATALFRVRYTGGTSAATGDTFAGSASPQVRVDVIRALRVTDRSTRLHSIGRFTLSPKRGLVGKPVVFQVHKGKRWKRYLKVRVPSKGAFKVSFHNSRRGVTYRLVVPAAGGLSRHVYGPITAKRP